MGSRIRFVALGDEIDFRLQTAQAYRLEKHRFHLQEAMQPLLNRQLRRLARAIVNGTAPTPACVEEGNKDRKLIFRPEKVLVEPFLLQQRTARKLATVSQSAALLVNWSTGLPLLVPLMEAESALKLLLEHYEPKTPVSIRDALLVLYERCDVGDAKRWLWELKEAGKLTLTLPRQEHLAGGVVRLPDGRGKLYYYLHL
jgi:hypothetical protein